MFTPLFGIDSNEASAASGPRRQTGTGKKVGNRNGNDDDERCAGRGGDDEAAAAGGEAGAEGGVGVATGMLTLGLFVGAGGTSAAPLDAPVASPAPVVQAGTTSASSYYNPTIAVPSYVASGDAIAIGGAGFDACDAVGST